MPYIHQLADRPRFQWRTEEFAALLAAVRHRQGGLTGHIEGLGIDLRSEVKLTTLSGDVIKSSEIEWENLKKEKVRSSIARRLGMLLIVPN